MGKTSTYVGLGVHKDTIVVAPAEMGARGDVCGRMGPVTAKLCVLAMLATNPDWR